MHAPQDFELCRPATLDDAVAALAAGETARPVAGGTDLLPNLRRGLLAPARLVDLSAVRGFADVEVRDDGSATLGAGLTLAALADHAALMQRFPALAEAARSVAGPGHRSAATLGGNLCQDTRCVFYNQSEWWRAANGWCLKRGGDTCHVAPQGSRCHAAFCSDLAPVLLALGAEAEMQSVRSTRRAALETLYRDDGAAHLTLDAGELLVCLHLPAPAGRCRYAKARARGAMDFPLAAVAVALACEDGLVTHLRVGVAGTNSHPLLLQGTGAFFGSALDEAALAKLGKRVAQQVSPMRSTTTPANHRRQVAQALVLRLLRQMAADPNG